MAFRIRSTMVNSGRNWKTKDNLYRKHLAKFDKRSNSDLWRYFYWDFFHDGTIEKISFWENRGDITLYLDCPNIKRKIKNDFEYVNIGFKCIFRNVVYFHYDHPDPEDLYYKQHNSFQFMGSEINTLKDIIKKKNVIDDDGDIECDFDSLIIEVLGHDSLFYIEMVFSQVDVIAEEPTAFQLMLALDQFEVPIYEEDKNK